MEEDGFVLVKRRSRSTKVDKASHSTLSESLSSPKLTPIETDFPKKNLERIY